MMSLAKSGRNWVLGDLLPTEAGSRLSGVRSAVYFSAPATLSTADSLPDDSEINRLLWLSAILAMTESGAPQLMLLRLAKMRPSSPRLPSSPLPPEIQSAP